MPEISRFYGIVIYMFFKSKEHEPSHIHAVYGSHKGVFQINSLKMIKGDLPPKAQKLVKEWLREHKSELQSMWDSQVFNRLPPLL